MITGLAFPESIWQIPSAKSGKDLEPTGHKGAEAGILLSRLSFSHLIELAMESDELKRAFYELQAIKGNWSVMELQRQMGSLLYERTGLSTNKEGLIGLIIPKNCLLSTKCGLLMQGNSGKA